MPAEQLAAGAAAAGPAAPSPAMLQAADGLQQLLRALAQHLDAVVFRCARRAAGWVERCLLPAAVAARRACTCPKPQPVF